MANWGQFERENEKAVNRPAECELCEAMCPDAVDGTLTEAERRVFERHVFGCVSCAKELAEAQRGAAWLGMLKGHTPEPPAALLAKILAETTGRAAIATSPVKDIETLPIAAPVMPPPQAQAPAWALSSVWRTIAGSFRIDPRRATFQPQMAMTTAMAFFSIALTMNLVGVRLRDIKASDFRPSTIRRTMADASASAARSFESLRVVYQVESRVSELRGEGPLADQVQVTPDAASTNGTQSGQPAQSRPAPHQKGL